MKKYLVFVFVISSLIFADNLLTNGDFEQDLSIGWLQDTYGSSCTISRATYHDADPDYEAYVYKGNGDGHSRLHQTIDVTTTNLDFSINARIYAYDNHVSAWAAAAVVVAYLDEFNTVLGETRICIYTQGCPWTNTPTMHLIPADPNWQSYSFNIDDELDNLPGIDPTAIKKIRVVLKDTTQWC